MKKTRAICFCIFLSSLGVQAQIWPFQKTDRQRMHQGNLDFAEGNYEKSKSVYEEIYLQNTKNDIAAYNLAGAEYKMKNLDNAIRLYENGLMQSKDDNIKEKMHYNLGNAYYEKGDMDKAVDNYKKALKINPENENAKYNLSYIRKQLQQNPPPPPPQEEEGEPEKEDDPQMNEKQADNILDNLDDKEKKLRKDMNKKSIRNDKQKDW